jgi:hypothetical protein
MTDQTIEGGFAAPRARHHSSRGEFTVYFAIIFLAALPLATLAWGLSALKRGSLTDKGPVSRAWSQARIITPMIFAA